MVKYITVTDIKNNKIELDTNGNIIIKGLPIYQIVSGNDKNFTHTIEDIKSKQIYTSGIGNLICIY